MRDKRLQSEKVVCLGSIILGICGSINTVVGVKNAWKMAVIAVFFSCIIYLIGIFGRKQKCIAVLIWGAGVGIFLTRCWENLGAGAVKFVNVIIQRINAYYHTSYLLWYQKEDNEDMKMIFLLILLIIGMLETVCLWERKRKSAAVAVAVMPVLLLIGNLMLGKGCSFWGMFWSLLAFFWGKLLPFQKEKGKTVIITVTVFALTAVTVASPLAGQFIKKYHTSWYQKQLQLEDAILAFGEEHLNLKWIFSGDTQKKQALSNQKPNQTGKEMFRITVSKLPRNNIYLRGFVGEVYERGTWTAGNVQEFSDLAGSQGYSAEEYARNIQNAPYQFIKNYGKTISEISIQMINRDEEYTLIPYFCELDNEMDVENDGTIKFYGKKDYTVEGNVASIWDIYESGVVNYNLEWKEYQQYVREHDLVYPAEGLEQIEALAKNAMQIVSTSEEYTPHSSVESIVKNILWHNTTYSLELEPLPEGEEFAEYFLFQQKKGFCVHYATAGTLLFRMLGVPARYVSGYVVRPTDFKANGDGTYTAVVTDKRAHAWTEIFWNGVGFYPVEVTPPNGIPRNSEETEAQTTDNTSTQTWQETENPQESEGQQEKEVRQEELQKQVESIQGESDEQQNLKEHGTDTAGGNSDTQDRNYLLELQKILEKIMPFLVALSVFFVIALAFRIRRICACKKKYRLFHQNNYTNGTIELGREICRILNEMHCGRKKQMTDQEYGAWLEQNMVLEYEMSWKEFVDLQQQAAFSEKKISEEEWRRVLHLYERLKRELIHRRSGILILYWKYVKIVS